MRKSLLICGLLVAVMVICSYAFAATTPVEKAELYELYQKIQELKANDLYDAALWNEYNNLTPGNKTSDGRLDQGGEDCDNATVVGALPYSDSGTLGATDDCATTAYPYARPYNDVFYVFTAPSTTDYEFNMCDSDGDTYMRIFTDGVCCSETFVTADDECGGLDPKTTLSLTQDQVVYIECGYYSNQATPGAYNFNVTELEPCVNYCLDPIPMGYGTTFTDTRNSCIACDILDCVWDHDCTYACYVSGLGNVYIFTIENDATITLTASGDGDNQLMVSTACGEHAPTTCVASADETLGGEDEVIGPMLFTADTYYVQVSVYGTGNCGDLTLTVTSDQPLPVELSSFEAIAGDAEVTLIWATASELNNDHFSVERNGVEIAVIDGAGNSETVNNYEYTDHAVTNGVTYSYQLVSYDINGTRHDYQTVEATPQGVTPSDYVLDQNYPNPFNPTTSISYSLKDAGFVTLKVYNLLGQEVANLVSQQMDVGQYSVTFDANNLPAGIYVYRLEVNNFSAQKKMVLLK